MTRTREESEQEAAALWVARHLGGIVDASAFTTWLAGDPTRRRRFDDLWSSCMDPAVTEALAATEQRQATRRTGRRSLLLRIGAPVAAAMVLGVMLSWPALRFALTPAQDYAAGIGEVRTFALADGSRVTLGSGSRLSVRLAADRRRVELREGEAYFDVAHDAGRPFTVLTDNVETMVIGTRFDLALVGADVELAVAQGLVRFGPRDESRPPLLVKAGYRTAFHDGRWEPIRSVETPLIGGWRDGWMEADDMPLRRLTAELSRWSGQPIEIEGKALADKRIAGRFRLADPARQLDNLALVHGFRVRRAAGKYILSE